MAIAAHHCTRFVGSFLDWGSFADGTQFSVPFGDRRAFVWQLPIRAQRHLGDTRRKHLRHGERHVRSVVVSKLLQDGRNPNDDRLGPFRRPIRHLSIGSIWALTSGKRLTAKGKGSFQ